MSLGHVQIVEVVGRTGIKGVAIMEKVEMVGTEEESREDIKF